MHRSLQLALSGAGRTAPNPMVGAVLVHDGRVIGEGYHEVYGGPHAEVNCINSVLPEDRLLIAKSTLYVSLEPCDHFGKTPPCTELILSHSIPKVVVGCRDLHEKVNGAGLDRLRSAGVEIMEGICEQEANMLNRRFFTFHRKKRPYIILKWAQSSDGYIGKRNERIAISNELTNRLVHKWRSEEAAIMVGTETAITDDPSLTTRLWSGSNPVRVVFDLKDRLPDKLVLFGSEAPTIILSGSKEYEKDNILYLKLNLHEDTLAQAMQILHRQNIQSVLVEGGAKLLQSFIDAGSWDESRVIVNNHLVLSSGIISPSLQGREASQKEEIRGDSILYYNNSENNC